MRTLVIFLFVLVAGKLMAQSNLVFSIPKDYDIKVTIPGYNSTKPKTWQVKFDNIPQGNIKVTVVITKPGSDSKEEQAFLLNVERGYEYTYFITPYKTGTECNLANVYTLEQVYGKNSDNVQPSNDTRLNTYNGKPVLSVKDMDDFVAAAAQQKYGSDIITWLKKQMPAFYFYTDDIVRLIYTLKYDSDKLELAKFAYDYSLDKHLYFKLGKTFQYSSTAEDLASYVSERD